MACRSCALPDTPGLCRPVPGGAQDPRGKCADKGAASCQGTGLCDVAGDCAVYPAGTICQVGGCSDNGKDLTPMRTCNGTGKCDDAESRPTARTARPAPPGCACSSRILCSPRPAKRGEGSLSPSPREAGRGSG